MIKSLFSIAFLSCSFTICSQTKTIQFEQTSFAEIKAKALKENKLIFVDAFTTWCGPCKQMAKNIFTNDSVADYYNSHFVNAKIDMEKGEGLEIAKQYEVKCYPNLLFIDGNGTLVHRVAGSMSVKSFMALAQDATQPEKQFSYYAKNYEANKANTDFLLKYIEAREGTCLESDEIVKDYFSQQKQEDLTSKANWNMILLHVNKMDSKEFTYVLEHKQKYIDLYSEKLVNGKIDEVNQQTLYSIIKTKPFDEKKYADTKAKIQSLNTPNTKLVLFEADLKLAERTGNWVEYTNLATANVDAYYLTDANLLNSVAWNFYENVEDKKALQKAEEWAKKACELENSYANLDTYAAVLYKTGKKDLALTTANKAIKAAKQEKYTEEDYQGTTDLIKKIRAVK